MYNQKEFILALKAREVEAYSYLYDKYSGAIFNIIRQIIPNNHIAEDLLKEIFIDIWQKIESYDASKARLFTWMHSLARNASIEALKLSVPDNANMNSSFKKSTDPQHETGAMTPENCFFGSGKTMAILLGEKHAIFRLSYFKGYTNEQIAALEGISADTVKIRARDCFLKIKEYLHDESKTSRHESQSAHGESACFTMHGIIS